MSKVALLTWYDNENYGTALQAFALQKSINRKMKCEIIKYKTPFGGYGIDYMLDPVLRRDLLYKIYDHTIMKVHKNAYIEREKERRMKMEDFFNNKLVFSPYNVNAENISVLNQYYDRFVCGSDQIWNPNNFDGHFYLDFVTDDNIRIAYAPSFGVASIIDEVQCKTIHELLKKFNYLSIRESAGKKIIEDIAERDCDICLDPTLLLDRSDWEKLADESTITLPSQYVFTYLLGRNHRNLKKSKIVANTLKKNMLVQPYYLPDYVNGEEIVSPSGPADFLNAIRNSSFVCTDSFHGTIFAILFRKPFVLFSRFNSKNRSSQNSRVESLLNLVGLSERLDFNNIYSKTALLDMSFTNCEKSIELERKRSLEYLYNAL